MRASTYCSNGVSESKMSAATNQEPSSCLRRISMYLPDSCAGGILLDAWSEMRGDDGGMAPYKLLGRTEAMDWQPPVLAFEIERHGGTAARRRGGGAAAPPRHTSPFVRYRRFWGAHPLLAV